MNICGLVKRILQGRS